VSEVGFFEGIARELAGPGRLRLLVQPLMALVLGVRLGIVDAKEGKPPFLFRLLRTSQRPWALFRASLWDVAIPLTLAVGLDSVLQYLAMGFVRPLAALTVAALLVWIPFAMSRAITNRVWRRGRHPRTPAATGARVGARGGATGLAR
jgi:hypothetical protein